jgi:hypothetical protein
VLEGDLAKLLVGLQQELAKLVCVNRHARLLAARAPSPWFAEVTGRPHTVAGQTALMR